MIAVEVLIGLGLLVIMYGVARVAFWLGKKKHCECPNKVER